MGFFSWKTSDTNKSISNIYSRRKPFTVHLIIEDGLISTESNYNGYGVFGGVDIYSFIGEKNGVTGKSQDEIRDNVFKELFLHGVKNGTKTYTYQKDFPYYDTPIEAEGGLCANELAKVEGWERFGQDTSFKGLAKRGLKVPKLVENLPNEYHLFSNEEKKKYFDSLPYPKNCPAQGYFY